MASEHSQAPEQTKPLEEKIADLHLQDKGGAVGAAAKDYIDTAKAAIMISAEDAKDVAHECKEATTVKDQDKLSEEPVSEEKNVAKDELAKSADEGAYAVPTVDHRSVEGPDGEVKKEDVPTAVVHENADTAEKEQPSKGIVGKISSSVKGIFTGMTTKTDKPSEDVKK